jgi:hypothetical protein
MAQRQRFRQRARVHFDAAFQARLVKRANDGVREVMEEIFKESQEEVPVDTGNLKASGKLRDTGKSIIITYGGPGIDINVDYAEIQHEDLSFNHPNGGKAKFIEDPLNRHKNDFARKGAQRLKDALDSGDV